MDLIKQAKLKWYAYTMRSWRRYVAFFYQVSWGLAQMDLTVDELTKFFTDCGVDSVEVPIMVAAVNRARTGKVDWLNDYFTDLWIAAEAIKAPSVMTGYRDEWLGLLQASQVTYCWDLGVFPYNGTWQPAGCTATGVLRWPYIYKPFEWTARQRKQFESEAITFVVRMWFLAFHWRKFFKPSWAD